MSSASDGRAAEPRVVLRDRSVAVDAQHAPGEVAADVGVVGEVVLDAVEIRVVEAEPIGAGDEQRAVAREDDAALARLRRGPRRPPGSGCPRYSRARATRSMPMFIVRRSASDLVQTRS